MVSLSIRSPERLRPLDADLPIFPVDAPVALNGAASFEARPAETNLLIANEALPPDFDVGGGWGTRAIFSKNGLCPDLFDKAMLLLLPLRSICMVF